jgi:hypothetical protein
LPGDVKPAGLADQAALAKFITWQKKEKGWKLKNTGEEDVVDIYQLSASGQGLFLLAKFYCLTP